MFTHKNICLFAEHLNIFMLEHRGQRNKVLYWYFLGSLKIAALRSSSPFWKMGQSVLFSLTRDDLELFSEWSSTIDNSHLLRD